MKKESVGKPTSKKVKTPFNFYSPNALFLRLLTVAFIVLKLTHVIDWSWVWVLAPLWYAAGLMFVLCMVFGVVVGLIIFIAVVVDYIDIQLKKTKEKNNG